MGTLPLKRLAALRQLALTAPSGRQAAIEVIALIQDLVGFETAWIYWLDSTCTPIDVIRTFYTSYSMQRDYLENFVNHPAREEPSGLSQFRSQTEGHKYVFTSQNRIHADYMDSEFYNRIGRHVAFGWGLVLPLRLVTGAPCANFIAGRSIGDSDFDPNIIPVAVQIQRWLEHLLRKDVISDPPCEAQTATGSATVLIDSQGRILSASKGGLDLLHQAVDVTLGGGDTLDQIADLLRRFGQSVTAALCHQPTSPPALSINNRWGRFHLRAYALNAAEPCHRPDVVLYIERFTPKWRHLFSAPRFLALTSRERETCLHLLAGLTHAQAAREMGVKPATVIYFARQIYARLNISSRDDLFSALTETA